LEPPEGFAFAGVRELFESMDESLYSLAGRAVQIVDWDRTHRFCGRCGAPTERLSTERARRCPACGLTSYPRLAPAVITLVERDGKALLARNPNFTSGFYSILAGFVEPGESLEEAVQREIHEEVGIEVTDIRYFGSQPWPFPHSLMIGFTAQYAGGEITPDPAEIADAGWFAPDEFPQIPGKISISRALIDDFVRRMGNR
jgi:NAD+ diphosphatase